MTISPPQTLDRPVGSGQSKWYRVYFVLAAFDILTVCVSLAITHRLVDMYKKSVDTDRVWADRLATFARLDSLAAQTDAPGNDVLESRDLEQASTRLDAAVAGFSIVLDDARQELRRNLSAESASPLLQLINDADVAMQRQVVEARSIFTDVRANDIHCAVARMAAMDRAFYDVIESLASLSHLARSLQHEKLESQASAATTIRQIEYGIAALIVVMVTLAVLYGSRLVQRANIDGRLRDLARVAQENAARAQRHSEALAEALANVEMQKRAMDEHSIVAITDSAGKITYVNDKFCKISKYSPEELIGQDHRIVNSGYHPRIFFTEMWKTITAGSVWHGEVCNRAKDGSLYWVETTIVPVKDESGSVTKMIAVRTEITERKRRDKELQQAKMLADAANRAKSEFLANMSHEIRTPMTAILGFAENMLGADQSEMERVDCIRTIRRNGGYLLGLINDILDLSKIEAGKMTIESKDCRPHCVVAEVASLMRVRADAKGLPFNIEYIGAIPETIQTDATRLRQILTNLVGNAIKFTEVGAVRLVTRFVGGDAPSMQFDIIDTGRGMTREQVAKLFQPFTQADNSTTREFGGTGLGLTISKRFAELLGGDITVAETELGEGTTFRVTVATGLLDGVKMLEDPTSATIVTEDTYEVAHASRTDLTGLRILLAEDGPDNQRLISFILKKAGAEVTVEENGKLALGKVLASMNQRREGDPEHPFDLILMDMQMPVMDGYEATKQLRQRGFTGPIIALTAHAMAGDREKCIKAGCDDYASKPIDRKKLIEMIKRHVVGCEPELKLAAAATCAAVRRGKIRITNA